MDNGFKVRKGLSLENQTTQPANGADGDVYFDTTLGFQGYSNGAWGSIGGAAGSGGFNFVGLNSSWLPIYQNDINFDATIGNWAAYADAPGVQPVDMTGGSPNITITKTTVSGQLLNGRGSGLITKGAFNYQGQGVSVNAYIPLGYRGQIASIAIPFKLNSGTLVQGDLAFFVYDVTNSQVLVPFNNDIIGSQGMLNATFDVPSNCEQIRVGFHFASTSTSAVSLSFDDVFVGFRPLVGAVSDFGFVGQIIALGTTDIPMGTLLCDGSAISRSGYPNLFAAIGEAYGNGDGSTTFNLPDLRGRFLRGQDDGAGNDPDAASRIAISGGNTGDAVGSYQTDDFGSHQHFGPAYGGGGLANAAAPSVTPGPQVIPTSFAGGNETRPKNVYVQYVIVAEMPNSQQAATIFNVSSYLAAGTQVTGVDPAVLGEYRAMYRASSSSNTLSDCDPLTIAPTLADGLYLDGSIPFGSAGSIDVAQVYKIFVGKNKQIGKLTAFSAVGRTGQMDISVILDPTIEAGIYISYDPSLGILYLDAALIQNGGTNTGRFLGTGLGGIQYPNGYFDVTISENVVPVQIVKTAPTIKKFTADDTYIVPFGVAWLRIRAAGGGGAGGSSTAAGGGGSGAYFEHIARNIAAGVQIPITIGLGATGASGTGGDTIVGGQINITASGGGGGAGVGGNPAAAPGGIGGTCSGDITDDTIALNGSDGQSGLGAATVGLGGGGGCTPYFGGGGRGGNYPSSSPEPGHNPGAGGGGGYNNYQIGADGIVIIEEYYY